MRLGLSLSTVAFQGPASKVPVCHSATARASTVQCSLDEAMPRRAVLAALGLSASGAAPAFAGWAGESVSLGVKTTSPKDADRDDDLLATKEVQAGLSNLKAYKQTASALKVRAPT